MDFTTVDVILLSNPHNMLALPYITEVGAWELCTEINILHVFVHTYVRTCRNTCKCACYVCITLFVSIDIVKILGFDGIVYATVPTVHLGR